MVRTWTVSDQSGGSVRVATLRNDELTIEALRRALDPVRASR